MPMGARVKSVGDSSVLLPGGKRSRILDKAAFEQALKAADGRFEKAIEELRAQRDKRGRERAA